MIDKRLQKKWWRLTHLYKIKNKLGEIVTFYPNLIQLKYLIDRKNHNRNRILKARQFGFTTLCCIDLLDEALWVPGMSCAIIAHEREATDKIFDIVKRAYRFLPEEIKPITKTDTKRRFDFTTRYDGEILDSSIYVALKIRGGTVLKLHISEVAYIKDIQELNAGSKQAVPLNGYITEETTGNGFDDFYDNYSNDLLKQQQNKLSNMDYMPHFYAWFENSEYNLPGNLTDKTPEEIELQNKFKLTDQQLIWRRWKINELKRSQDGVGLTGIQLFKQEYPTTIQEAFQSGSGNVFDGIRLESIRLKIPLSLQTCLEKLISEEQKEKVKRLFNLGIRIWALPEYNKKYIIGGDPSDGLGSDNSCLDVWDEVTTEQVAQFYGKVRPDELADITKELAEFYNNAFVGIENNMLTTILLLSKIYDNYFFTTTIDERTAKRTKKIGWSTNIKTRDVMIDEFIIFFDEGHLIINSPITIKEMKTFVKKENGKREHADGKHDDSVIAAMIAIQMRKYNKPRSRAFERSPI
jgi:hypothetical protein